MRYQKNYTPKIRIGMPKDIQRALAERDLASFIAYFWRYIDPSEFISGWHIDACCEHLEAVTYGDIKRLIITMPPRHMKSIAAAVTWPAWSWIKRPELRFLFSSYAASLSIRDSVKCRRLIESPLYQEWWGERFKMTGDQNTKIRFDNDKQGYRISTSVDGANTGEGGDIICIDDPHNVKEIESAVKRLSVLDWWDGVMSTRLNDMTEGAYVIIAQRSHHNDLIGHILKQEDWVHLNLPAEYEPSVKCQTCISWEDPRKEEGELLWPAKFSKVDIETLKTKLGSYRAAAQLQQRPSPKGGGIIQIDWFNYLEVIPFTLAKIQSWDTAFKEKTMNDYSVCETWLRIEAGYMLIDIWRGKVGYPELKRMAIALYDRDKPNAIIIEDAASGQSLIQDFKKTPMPVLARTPDKDKISRASTVAPTIEAGKVFLLAGQPWLADFLDEIQQFPTGEYKDQVDALSQALNYLIAGGLYTGPIAMGESVASKGDDL